MSALIRAALISTCLFWVYRRSPKKGTEEKAEEIPLEERKSLKIIEVLHSTNKPAIKCLIMLDHIPFNRIFRMININGSGGQVRFSQIGMKIQLKPIINLVRYKTFEFAALF